MESKVEIRLVVVEGITRSQQYSMCPFFATCDRRRSRTIFQIESIEQPWLKRLGLLEYSLLE